MKKDRMSLVKGIMYLIRDVLYYSELVEIKQFLESIMEDKKQSNKYNGWTNYETWNFNLWITNEEEDYSKVLELAFDSEDEYELSKKLEELALEMAEDYKYIEQFSGFIMDMINSSIKEVNFYEVATHLWEERQEAIREHDGEVV